MNHYAIKQKMMKARYQERVFISDIVLKILLFSIFLITFQVATLNSIEIDHIKHIGVSMSCYLFLSQLLSSITYSHVFSFIASGFVGLCKEIFDPIFDWTDMAANSVGLIIGFLIILFLVLLRHYR